MTGYGPRSEDTVGPNWRVGGLSSGVESFLQKTLPLM